MQEFEAWDLGCRVGDFASRVVGLGCRVYDVKCRAYWGVEFRL